jgi:tetratricopeptide (TPR) repeat protein
MYQKKTVYLVFTGIIAFSLILTSCQSKQEGKIPVTTSSPEALKLFSKGIDLYDNLRNQEAHEYFKRALEKDPDFALAYLNYGSTANDLKIFFSSLNKALSLMEKISEGERFMILGSQAGANGLLMKQREYYQQLVENYPQDERAHYLLGNYYYFLQDFNLAIGEYRRATEINSKYPPAYNMLGYAHRQLENFDEAEEAFKNYIKIIPDNPNPYDSYAELLMKKGEFEKSIETYKKALKIDPHFIPSHIGIATDLNFLNRHQEARTLLQAFLQQAQTQNERRTALYAMIISYLDESDYPQALGITDTLLAMSFQSADTGNISGNYEIKGIILQELGRLDEAEQNFQLSQEIIQQSNLSTEFKANVKTIALYHSARINIERNKLPEAKIKAEELGRQAETKKNRFQIWLYHELLGLIAIKEMNYDEALGEYRRANMQEPYNLYRMGLAYQAKGDLIQAIKYCERVVNHNTLDNLSYSFVRHKARTLLEQMRKQ